MKLIEICEPKSVLLVHGELEKMEFLKKQIEHEFHIECFNPANGETCSITTPLSIKTNLSMTLLKDKQLSNQNLKNGDYLTHGILIFKDTPNGSKKVTFQSISDVDEACDNSLVKRHLIQFRTALKVHFSKQDFGFDLVVSNLPKIKMILYKILKNILQGKWNIQLNDDDSISIESISIQLHLRDDGETNISLADNSQFIVMTYSSQHFELANALIRIFEQFK